MKVKKRGDQYWILGVAQMDPEGMGPYPSKEEADYHIEGIQAMWKYGDKPGFVTVDKTSSGARLCSCRTLKSRHRPSDVSRIRQRSLPCERKDGNRESEDS